jgi:hypothetical protein
MPVISAKTGSKQYKTGSKQYKIMEDARRIEIIPLGVQFKKLA